MGSPTCPTCKGTGHKLLLVNRFNPVTETAFQETAGWGPCPDCHPKFEAVARKLAEQLAKKADAMDANLTDQGFWWLAETVEKPTRYIADVPSCYGDYTPVATQARRWRTRTECADYCADSNKWRTLRVEPVQHGFTATPTPPAPADDASGAEAMREAFVAWQMEWAPKGDECERARIEWDKIGTPLARLVNGDIVCLENEWEAWQAARALPLPGATPDATRVPATDDAVEEARRAFYEAARAFCEEGRIAVVTEMLGGRNMIEPARNVAKPMLAAYDALLAAERTAALRREKGGA